MEIKEINKQDLEMKCLDILTKLYVDLGQRDNDPGTKVLLAQSLAKDLKRKYSKLPFQAVELAFYKGPRETELFNICPATWCKWLNAVKREVWEGWHHFELGNHHVIQKHVKEIMDQQPTLMLEYKKR